MEFVDPPVYERKARSDHWLHVVAELKGHKGEWAKVGNYSPGVATNIRRGKYPAFLGGWEGDTDQLMLFMGRHWEVRTSKTNGGNKNDVYVRWLG